MGSDLSITNAARVSFHKESAWEGEHNQYGVVSDKKLSGKDQKLIAYLAKNSHWSPFAHAFLSFRIKAPVFVARQLVKHQVGLAWNEVSRRYVDDEPEFFFPEVWRKKAENVKQGSSDAGMLESYVEGDNNSWGSYELTELCLDWYQKNIKLGMAPEQARMILPQNMMTEWIWSGSLMAFARVVKLRRDPHAQAETREVAQMINNSIPKEFEYSWKALLS